MSTSAAGATVIAQTMSGAVRGRWRDIPHSAVRSAAFLGIPFAQPTVGGLRFAAPVPVAAWDGIRDALEHGPTAQRGEQGVTLIPEPSVPGESTLNVNVFTPDPTRREAPLPVLVWIHGGAFVAGSPASPWYDGRAFNRDGVVTVSLSYRLGFDGFGHIDGAPSNRGVRDWLAGLEWVRANIASFGGDPERVTIAGQSAGGGAVLTLLGMPQAQHLFHQAYSLSGALTNVSLSRATAFTARVAKALNVPPTRAGFATVHEAALRAAQSKAGGMSLSSLGELMDDGLSLGPVVDGDLIVRPTKESLALGVGADKPLILGATDDEFAMVVRPYARLLRFVPLWLTFRPFRISPAVRRAYLAANADVTSRGHAAVLGRLISDKLFRTTVVAVSRLRASAPTWAYRVAFRSPVFGAAVHCVDVPFFFDCLDGPSVNALTGPNPPQALAEAIHGAAVAFVCSGDPGWTAWSTVAETTQVFGADAGPAATVRGGLASVEPLLQG